MPSNSARKSNNDDAQKSLRGFYERRHPLYEELIAHWEFLDACYRGGRGWFADNIFRYHKEGEKEFADRLKRAYRFNHTREVVDLIQKYLFKAKVSRTPDAPQEIQDFWLRATKAGLSIDQLMRQVSVANSIGGRCALVVDNNFAATIETVTGAKRRPSVAEAKEAGYRIYAYVVPTKHILDYAFDEDGDGELLWIKLREIVRDDANPMTSTGLYVNRVRLWTRTHWLVYEEVEMRGQGNQQARMNIVLHGSDSHDLGFVPVKLVDHTVTEDPYRAPGLIDEVAYLDRAVSNYLSSLDAIIQDQTFSQLAIPAQALQQGDDMYKKVLEMGTKRIFVYDAGAGSSSKPEFLSPDPKQAGVILNVISKIINEIYHTVGLAGERTKEDNSVGIDNSSGVAKAYDFERVNSLLLSKAQSCETAENWLCRTVMAWASTPLVDDLVQYPKNFDVMRLIDDLVTAEALAKLDAPRSVRREQMRLLVEKLLPKMKLEETNKIQADINTWLDNPELGIPPTLSTALGSRPVAAQSRQGEVTASTK